MKICYFIRNYFKRLRDDLYSKSCLSFVLNILGTLLLWSLRSMLSKEYGRNVRELYKIIFIYFLQVDIFLII